MDLELSHRYEDDGHAFEKRGLKNKAIAQYH